MPDFTENKIIFDWLAFTVHEMSVDEVITMLGFNEILGDFTAIKGNNGYQDGLYFESISIYYNGKSNQGVHVNFSGKGCRAFESYSAYGDFDQLIPALLSLKRTKITRLDVAYDDFCNFLPINDIVDSVKCGEWTSPASVRWWEAVYSSVGTSCYIGSPGSRIRFRFYDKAAEQKKDYQWTRLEIQMRDEQATAFLHSLYDNNDITISDIFFGVVNNYIRFIYRDSTRTNTCTTKEWWLDFLEHGTKVKLWSPGIEYNIGRLKYNVENRWGSAIQTYLSCFGPLELQAQLNQNKPITELPVNYRKMLFQYAKDWQDTHALRERKLASGEEYYEVFEIPKSLEDAVLKLGGDFV